LKVFTKASQTPLSGMLFSVPRYLLIPAGLALW
jgi:hypothetical protein